MRYMQMLATVMAGVLLAAGCTKADTNAAQPAAKPVAVVNGKPITRDVWDLFIKVSQNGKKAEDLTAEERNKALDDLISMYVGAEEATKQKLDAGEPAARIELSKNSMLAELLYKKMTEGKEPTEQELKAMYDERVAEMPKSEYHARHILVADEAKAKDLIAQLDKGASFEKLAKDNSSDGSAAEGGDLGWFLPAQMVKPFADAVQQLEQGKYTATPVKSDFGWHVIRLEGTRATTPPAYDSVKAQLGPLVNQKKFENHLKELVKAAKVERSL